MYKVDGLIKLNIYIHPFRCLLFSETTENCCSRWQVFQLCDYGIKHHDIMASARSCDDPTPAILLTPYY